jgi:hypothetical protein
MDAFLRHVFAVSSINLSKNSYISIYSLQLLISFLFFFHVWCDETTSKDFFCVSVFIRDESPAISRMDQTMISPHLILFGRIIYCAIRDLCWFLILLKAASIRIIFQTVTQFKNSSIPGATYDHQRLFRESSGHLKKTFESKFVEHFFAIIKT